MLAGAGKHPVWVRAYARLVADAFPRQILALTFRQ